MTTESRYLLMLLGIFLVVVGVIFLFAGSNGISTPILCNAYLCRPLTAPQLWQIQWRYYVELFGGISSIVAGLILLLMTRFVFLTKSSEAKKELTTTTSSRLADSNP